MPTDPRLLVLATGGTIGMRETAAGIAPDPDFPEVLEDMLAEICEPLGIDWRVNHLQPPIDSANADADTAPRIARTLSARVRTQQPRGVVVLHGTDTLAYTGARLAFELSGLGSPVVLTGSQLPHGAEGSDARDNLSLAVRAAMRASRTAPVSIAFGGAIVPAVRATKHHSAALEAFRAELPLGGRPAGIPKLDDGSRGAASARVISFRFVPGVTADDLRGAVAGAPDGLVLECYGSGNGPMDRPGMRDALREIAARIPVVAITQCTAGGGVDLARYAVGRELARTGVITGSDLTLEAAIAKLGWLIDRGAVGNILRDLLPINLIGECTPTPAEDPIS